MPVTRKVLSAAVVVLCAVGLSVSSQAVAGTPGYPGCTIEVTLDEGGGSVHLVGSGFQPDFTTEIFIDDVSAGTVVTDAAGAFETDVDVPDGAGPGTVAVTAACDGTGDNVSSSELTLPGGTLPDLTLSDTSVERLEGFVATVTDARPGTMLDFERFSVAVPVGSITADAEGTGSLTISFPADATLGTHEVQATGVTRNGNPFELSRPIEVVADGAAGAGGDGGDDLARTGSDVESLVIIGGFAVLVGAAFVLVGKRRRRASS
jgi:LPXTG-motif cell wall-anchored protein